MCAVGLVTRRFDLHPQVVETLFDIVPDLVFHSLVVQSARVHVDGGGLPGAAAKQVVHGHVRQLSLDIPQCLIDTAESVSQYRAVAPVRTDVGGLPYVFYVGDAAANEKRTQIVVHRGLDRERLPVVRRAAEAVQAGLRCFDLHDCEGVVVRLSQDRPDIADFQVAQKVSSNAPPIVGLARRILASAFPSRNDRHRGRAHPGLA